MLISKEILAVFAATVGVISDGIQYGWSSPAIPLLMREDSPVPITVDDEAWLEMIYMCGGVAGLPFTIYIVDRIGRKWSIICASVMSVVAWIMIGIARRVQMLLMARFIVGVAADTAFVAAPMYIAEVANAKIRGFLGTFIYIMMIVGVLISYCIVPFITIWASSIVGAGMVVIQILIFFTMPESPYYLLIKSQRDEAKEALRYLRGSQDVDEEFKEIEAAVERQKTERGRPIDLLLVPSNRRALLIMTTLNTAQHFCGISVILMNVQIILTKAGTVVSGELSAILFGVCMLVASIGGAPLIDRFGRRVLLISSSLLSAFFLLILGSFFLAKDVYNVDVSDFQAVPLVALLCYAFSYKYGLGLVPIVTTGELYPTSVKAMGVALADLTYTSMALVSLEVYYATISRFGMYFPFLLFGCTGLFTAVFVYFIIPETKGKTLEEIQQMLKGN